MNLLDLQCFAKLPISMKNLTIFITLLAICSLCISCAKYSIDDAQEHFITNVQYMSEREALSREIDYYKPPQITVSRKIKDLTGKDAIHECNIMLKENSETDEAMRKGQIQFGRVWYVDKEKEYALDHPNDIVGAKFYFEGIFTHFANGYGLRKAEVICINGSWYVKQIY